MPSWAWFGLTTAASVVIVVVAALAHYRYWARRYRVELDYDSFAQLRMADGAAIELRRLKTVGRRASPTPVLLVHGLAFNHRNVDLLENASLARHLASRGRDVWLLTLRSGLFGLGRAQRRACSFAAMARHDLPAAVDHVLAETGSPSLDYVGFSMGGMLLYASLGRTVLPEKVHRAAFVGAPAHLSPPWSLGSVAPLLPRALIPNLSLRLGATMVAFASEWLVTPLHRMLYNPDNVERGIAPAALVNGFCDIPSPLAREFVAWSAQGSVVFDGVGVLDNVRKQRTAAVFVAGGDDHVAPARAVRAGFEAWGAEVESPINKSFRCLSVEGGAAGDYGHGDLMFGRFADVDVFEPIANFLEAE